MTNQVLASEGTTQATVQTAQSIVQVQIVEPVLNIRKGIIATDKAGVTYSPTTRVPANVVVSAPDSTCPRFSGAGMPVTLGNLDATFTSNVNGVEAGDLVTFAIVVEQCQHAAGDRPQRARRTARFGKRRRARHRARYAPGEGRPGCRIPAWGYLHLRPGDQQHRHP